MDFEKLRSDPRVAYLLGVGIGVALGLVIAARIRPQEALQAMQRPCPECERNKLERTIEGLRQTMEMASKDPGDFDDD